MHLNLTGFISKITIFLQLVCYNNVCNPKANAGRIAFTPKK